MNKLEVGYYVILRKNLLKWKDSEKLIQTENKPIYVSKSWKNVNKTHEIKLVN